MKKVFVGLSGGVDSAVSAALLLEEGYEVTGVFIRIALPGYPCSAGEDKISAMRVAAHLRIPFIEIDLSKEYKDEVFAYTVDELKKGRTPNPDTLCNQKIKFGHFWEFAKANGADFIATGHYAQTRGGDLYAAPDQQKDQSYFLWMVPREVLARTLFPVGHLLKSQVRELAAKFGLPNAARKDSQGLCFLGDISIDEMITREVASAEGDVLNETGEVIGKHYGVAHYTLSQRHGFELFAKTPHTTPYFVIGKNQEAHTITVSTNKFPLNKKSTHLTLSNTNWISAALPNAGVTARYRYHQPLVSVDPKSDLKTHTLTLLEPHYVPLGQSLVLYEGERCLGGGIVDNATLE